MSSPIFIHLNKLTYSMYMVSPIVITAAYGLKETSSHFDEATTVSLYDYNDEMLMSFTFTGDEFAWSYHRQLFNVSAVCYIL